MIKPKYLVKPRKFPLTQAVVLFSIFRCACVLSMAEMPSDMRAAEPYYRIVGGFINTKPHRVDGMEQRVKAREHAINLSQTPVP